MSTKQPIRVLHAFGSLNRGGIETWLMNILRLQPEGLQFDFLLSTLGGVYEEEARSYGCRIYQTPPIRQFNKYLNFLKKVLTEGRYDVLHIHGEEFMGDLVRVAAKVGTPVRIAHCHGTKLARGKVDFEMWVRGCRHRTLDRFRLLRHATDILACSSDSGYFLVGRHWSTDPRCKALFCGVPLDKFNLYLGGQSKVEYRKAHGIPEEAIVIGHAGSMGPSHVKNHPFILKVFAELARRSQHYYLYLAGDGPHRTDLLKIVKELGLQSRVIMPGLCDDVPSLMVHGFDVHLLPSFWEGLPVAGLEAVASGLFTVCSDSITKDFTDYFSERVVTVSLKADINIWADEVMEGVSKRLPTRQGVALVENSPFSIQTSCRELTDVYQNSLQKIGKNCLLAEQLM